MRGAGEECRVLMRPKFKWITDATSGFGYRGDVCESQWSLRDGVLNYRGRFDSLVVPPFVTTDEWRFTMSVDAPIGMIRGITTVTKLETQCEIELQLITRAWTPDSAARAGCAWYGDTKNVVCPLALVSVARHDFRGFVGDAIDLWMIINPTADGVVEEYYTRFGNLILPRHSW
jgi:hypothetical protein